MARKREFKQQNTPIVVVGEGITEFYYMKKLKQFLPTLKPYSLTPQCFDKNTGYVRLEKEIANVIKNDKHVIVFVLYDIDVAQNSSKAMFHLQKIKTKYKSNKNVIFCGSMPDIEYWFLLHFVDTNRSMSSNECLSALKKHIEDYEKTKKYLSKDKWIEVLMGDKQNTNLFNALNRAKTHSKQNNKDNCSYTDIYKMIDLLRK